MHDRPPSEEDKGAVGLDRGVVTGDGVALPIEHPERGRGLGLVLVVALGTLPGAPRVPRGPSQARSGCPLLGDAPGRHETGETVPVGAGAPAVEIDMPIAPSLAAMRSMITACGRCPSSPDFTSAENIAPDDEMNRTHARSRDASSSSAASMGRANGSPTTVIALTRSAATVSHRAAASKRRPSSSTTVPPVASAGATPIPRPVLCISGGRRQRDEHLFESGRERWDLVEVEIGRGRRAAARSRAGR